MALSFQPGSFESGAAPAVVAILDPPIEDMRYCEQCDGVTRCVAEVLCGSGHVFYCTRCGDERIAPYTREISEAV